MENKDSRLSVTFYVIFLALLFLVFAQGAEWRAWPQLARGNVGSPYVLGFVHFFVIGFVLQMMFGVLLKIVPIAFQGTLYSRRLGFLHPWLLAIGDLVLVLGFFSGLRTFLIVGGSLIVLGAGLFLYNLGLTVRTLRNKTAVLRGIQLALLYISIALLLGLTTAIDLLTPLVPNFAQLVQVHVLIAVFAGFTQLISAVSYKLLPMFLLSIKPKVHSQWTYGLQAAGLLLALLGIFVSLPILRWLAFLLFGGGFLVHAWDVRTTFMTRHRKAISIPLWGVLFGYAVWVGVSVALALLWAQGDLSLAGAGIGLFTLATFGWVPMILGYLLKIIPFLWFQHRYSHSPDRHSAPPLNLMIRERQGLFAIGLYVLTQLGFMFTSLIRLPITGGVLLLMSTASVFYFMYILALVPVNHRRPGPAEREAATPQ